MFQQEIDKLYEETRQRQLDALNERRKEVNAKVPQIIEIEQRISKLCIQLAMVSIRNPLSKEQQVELLQEEITNLKMQKAELLVGNGFSLDYFDVKYTCEKCKDTGYIMTERCECYHQYMVKVYYNKSDLPKILDTNNFDHFNFNYWSNEIDKETGVVPRQHIEKMVKFAFQYVRDFRNINTSILMTGATGTGKTFLSNCIAKELIDKGNLVIYRTAQDLISDLKKIMFENDRNLENIIINCDLLIVDDIGTEQGSDFAKSELYNLINKKIKLNKKMLFTTNLDMEYLLKFYSERIVSRLMGDFTLLKFVGQDLRLKKKLSDSRK